MDLMDIELQEIGKIVA
jgi:hypothetical protein